MSLTEASPILTTTTPADAASFDSHDPATGAVVASYPIHGEPEVRAAVDRARTSAAWWAGLGFDGRRRRLRRLQGVLTRRREELLEILHRENGKATDDAYVELFLALEHLGWAARHAEKTLGHRRVRGPALLSNHAGYLEYAPLGVIGVIGPWNYPLHTPMGSISYALAAGNAVVFKPSEYTPGVGTFLASAMAEVTPEHPVLQTVTGFGATGAALCTAGVDKVAFTGSPPTGRKILAACAASLTPVLLELGGKDALIVDDDGDVEAAAQAAVWGGCWNSGQTCAGVERVYATERVYDQLVSRISELAGALRTSDEPDGQLGPITMPAQIDVIQAHLDEALDRGATAVVGGRDSVHAPFVGPIVLTDVPEDTRVMREETFGPLLAVVKVRDASEAVAAANRSAYGLGSAVFSKRRGMQIARELRCGMTSVNGVLAYAGFPALPFGGVGESGFGRIHGADGLREFTRAKAITRQRFAAPVDMLSFDRPAWLPRALRRLDDVRYGRR